METKIKYEIEFLEKKIAWSMKDLEKEVKDFRESAAKYNDFDLICFLPSKLKSIEELDRRIREYKEQKRLLEGLLKD